MLSHLEKTAKNCDRFIKNVKPSMFRDVMRGKLKSPKVNLSCLDNIYFYWVLINGGILDRMLPNNISIYKTSNSNFSDRNYTIIFSDFGFNHAFA